MSNTTLETATQPARHVPTETLTPISVPDARCASCPFPELCPTRGVPSDGCDDGRAHKFRRRKVLAGEMLYAQGDRFQFIYSLRCGTLKSTLTLSDGRTQVCGFHMAGEVMALDAVAAQRHGTTATALEDAQVCAIAYETLVASSAQDARLQLRMNRLMSHNIARGHSLTLLLGSCNAQERIASFLLDLSQRFDAHGYSAREFSLRMTRAEIGSYLGLALETVSRTFSTFQDQGLITVHKRQIRIADLPSFSRQFEALPQVR